MKQTEGHLLFTFCQLFIDIVVVVTYYFFFLYYYYFVLSSLQAYRLKESFFGYTIFSPLAFYFSFPFHSICKVYIYFIHCTSKHWLHKKHTGLLTKYHQQHVIGILSECIPVYFFHISFFFLFSFSIYIYNIKSIKRAHET